MDAFSLCLRGRVALGLGRSGAGALGGGGARRRGRSEAGCYSEVVITASVSPAETDAPAVIGSSAIVPDL